MSCPISGRQCKACNKTWQCRTKIKGGIVKSYRAQRRESAHISTWSPVYLSITRARQVASYILSVMQMSVKLYRRGVSYSPTLPVPSSPRLPDGDITLLLCCRSFLGVAFWVLKRRLTIMNEHLMKYTLPYVVPCAWLCSSGQVQRWRSAQVRDDVVWCGLDTNETI